MLAQNPHRAARASRPRVDGASRTSETARDIVELDFPASLDIFFKCRIQALSSLVRGVAVKPCNYVDGSVNLSVAYSKR